MPFLSSKCLFARLPGSVFLAAVMCFGAPAGVAVGAMEGAHGRGPPVLLRYADRDADLAAVAKQRLVEACVQVLDRAGDPERVRLGDRPAKKRKGEGFILALGATAVERDRWDDFVLAEGEATLTLSRNGSEEVLYTATQQANGRRTSIRNVAMDSARHEAFARALDRIVGRLGEFPSVPIVRDAVIVNVFSEKALLAIMEYLARLDGVKDVRRLSFDRTTNEAHLELVGDPGIEAFWRAYLEDMPKTLVECREAKTPVVTGYPQWLPLLRKE